MDEFAPQIIWNSETKPQVQTADIQVFPTPKEEKKSGASSSSGSGNYQLKEGREPKEQLETVIAQVSETQVDQKHQPQQALSAFEEWLLQNEEHH